MKTADLKKYTIVYEDNGYGDYNKDTAEYLRDKLFEIIGAELPVICDADDTVEYEIILGHADREEAHGIYSATDAPERMHYTVERVGDKYVLGGDEWFSTRHAVDKALEAIKGGKRIEDYRTHNEPMLKPFPARAGKYRALHYNILVEWVNWGCGGIIEGPIYKRVEPIMGIIDGYAPDFLCFCEVFERWAATLPAYLGHKYSFSCVDRGDNASNRTLVAYDRKKFKLLENGFENIAAVKSVNYRVVNWALLEDRESGNRILVCGTHWESTPNESDRQKQAAMTADIIKKMTEKYGAEAIIMGDFNTRPPRAAYSDFVTLSGMYDVEGGEGCAQSVDHIFATKGIKVAAVRREKAQYTDYASDHKPVMCDFDAE